MRHALHVPRQVRQPLTRIIRPEDLNRSPQALPRANPHARHLPKDAAARTLWLDASDLHRAGAVEKWIDKVNGRVFRRLLVNNFPPIVRLASQNDLPVVDFTDGAILGCEEFNTREVFGDSESTFTFLARHVYQNSGGCSFHSDLVNGGVGFYMAQNTTAYYDHGAGGGSTTRLSFAITREPDWAIYQLVKKDATMYYYRDGVLQGSGTGKTGNLNGSRSPAYLGHDNRTSNPTGIGSTMDLAEVRAYNRALTDAQLLAEREELRTKWRLGYRYEDIQVAGSTTHWDASSLAATYGIGSNITSWAALIGGSNATLDTVTATGPTYRENNGFPGARFTGAGYIKTSANHNPWTANDFSGFVVATIGVQVDAYALIIDHTHATPSNGNWVLQRDNLNNGWTWAYYRSVGGTLEGFTGTYPQWRGQGKQVIAINKNGTAMSVRNGRKSIVNYTLGASTYSAGARTMGMGGHSFSNRRFVGEVHEVILCAQGHADSEVDAICRQLARKWGVSL